MAKSKKFSVAEGQMDFGFDFGAMGFAAVTEAVAERQEKDNAVTMARAQQAAAKITASDLDSGIAKSTPKVETFDFYVDTVPPVNKAPTIDLPDVPLPFTELNKRSAKPFSDEPRKPKLDLPKSSTMAQDMERIRLAQEFHNKPVVGLMRTIHTVDRKLSRKQLQEKEKIEATAKKITPQEDVLGFFSLMVRKKGAETIEAAAPDNNEPEQKPAPRAMRP
jgi:hypothetical protein